MNHTPTPWEVRSHSSVPQQMRVGEYKHPPDTIAVTSVGGGRIAWLPVPHCTNHIVHKGQREANAEYIVRACNAYPALVAALQEIAARADSPFSRNNLTHAEDTIDAMKALASDALAAAGDGFDVDPEYEAMIADVGLHGENAEPQAMSDPLRLLDGTIRGEA